MNSENELLIQYDLQFFAKEGEGGEKTEPATARKLDKAREEGKVAKSQELTASFSLIAMFVVLKFFVSFIGTNFIEVFKWIYSIIPDIVSISRGNLSSGTVHTLFINVFLKLLLLVAPFFLIGFLVAFVGNLIQVGWKITGKPLEPKFDKFNPVNGFKRIFSKDSLVNLLKSILKIALIFYVAYLSIRGHANELFILYEISLNQALALMGDIIINTGLRISLVYLIIGVADYLYQKHKFAEDMKMTKQEVKDEYKDTEGDPQIKGQQRQRMREASMRRMMKDVPQADVVITNPTHIAVAIRYDAEKESAPTVLAKGEEYLAQRIKDVAKENNVPIKENKPLARALYTTVDIGQQVPPELYMAVAEVLALVYKDNGKYNDRYNDV